MAIRDFRASARNGRNQAIESNGFRPRRLGEHPLTVMLSPFSRRCGIRVNSAKPLALLFVGEKVQSEILRAVYPERAERDPSLRSG
jgi:hypothetical protein